MNWIQKFDKFSTNRDAGVYHFLVYHSHKLISLYCDIAISSLFFHTLNLDFNIIAFRSDQKRIFVWIKSLRHNEQFKAFPTTKRRTSERNK